MPDPITPEQVAENAAQPQSASVDGRSASQHSIHDQIKATQFAATDDTLTPVGDAPRSGWGALRGAVARPGGAHQ